MAYQTPSLGLEPDNWGLFSAFIVIGGVSANTRLDCYEGIIPRGEVHVAKTIIPMEGDGHM